MEDSGLEKERGVEYNRYFGEFDIIKINPKKFPPYLGDLPDPKFMGPAFRGSFYGYSGEGSWAYRTRPGLCSEDHPLVAESLSTDQILDSEAFAILDSPSGQRVVLMATSRLNWQLSNEFNLPSNKGLSPYEIINKKWDKKFALPFELRDDDAIASILIDYEGTLIGQMSERIRNNTDFIFQALSKCPCSLRDMPFGIRDNRDIVTYAASLSPIAIRYASARVKRDEGFIGDLAKKNPDILSYARMPFTPPYCGYTGAEWYHR
jgi:hypothetical protein